jgi:hypothetical protein
LRDFIQAGLAQESTDLGHPRINGELAHRRPLGGRPRIGCEQVLQPAFRIDAHGAELEAAKSAAIAADALLCVERGAAIGSDVYRDRQQQRRQEHQSQQRYYEIEAELPGLRQRRNQVSPGESYGAGAEGN